MNSKKTFAVGMIGIPESERHVLRNIFKLSQYRGRTYIPASLDEPSEILMVDADDPGALAEFKKLGGENTGGPTVSIGRISKSPIPTIMVTKERLPDNLPYFVRRPFVATRVLSVLDQVVVNELGTKEERVVGGESAPAPVVDESPIFKALVVDDSKAVRKQIELELKLLGVKVDSVESGEQAFELLELNTYDMIFLDVVLPGMDGYHICKTIKKDKIKKKIPVIMLTSKSSPFDRVRGALAGCNTYLTKPVKQSVFQKTVKKYLGNLQ
jgi:two-component system cell cycle response regulator